MKRITTFRFSAFALHVTCRYAPMRRLLIRCTKIFDFPSSSPSYHSAMHCVSWRGTRELQWKIHASTDWCAAEKKTFYPDAATKMAWSIFEGQTGAALGRIRLVILGENHPLFSLYKTAYRRCAFIFIVSRKLSDDSFDEFYKAKKKNLKFSMYPSLSLSKYNNSLYILLSEKIPNSIEQRRFPSLWPFCRF